MVHIDSSLALFAALRSPSLKLRNAGALLSPYQDYVMRQPECYVVIHEPCVYIRRHPTMASAAQGKLVTGKFVNTSGLWFGDWVELKGAEGWVLTDASNVNDMDGQCGFNLGPLLMLLEEWLRSS